MEGSRKRPGEIVTSSLYDIETGAGIAMDTSLPRHNAPLGVATA